MTVRRGRKLETGLNAINLAKLRLPETQIRPAERCQAGLLLAATPGGERADGAMRAARGFLAVVTSLERIHTRQAHWRNVLAPCGPDVKTEHVLQNLENLTFVNELADKVRGAIHVLEARYLAGWPVVYMLRNLAEDGGHPEAETAAILEPLGGLHRTHMPADRILARIDFVNGIAPNSLHYEDDALDAALM